MTPREALEQAFLDAGLQPLRQKRAGTVEFWGLAGQKYGAGFFVAIRSSRTGRRPRSAPGQEVIVTAAHIMRRRAGLTWYRPEKVPWPGGLRYSGGKGLDDLVERVNNWLTKMAERTKACRAVDKLVMSIRRDIRKAIKNGTGIPDPVALQDMAVAAVALYPEVTLDSLKTKDSTVGHFLDELLKLEKWTTRAVAAASEALCLPMPDTQLMYQAINGEGVPK